MEEYFTGGDDFYGSGPGVRAWFADNCHFWKVLCAFLAVALVIVLVIHFKRDHFTSKEGLYPGILSVRDDTGFPSSDSLAESARKREQLVEAGREPNLYNVDPVDLATQLAIRTATTTTDQEPTQTAALTAAMAANAQANPAKFTERMELSPEEKIKQQQAASAGLV